jgi:hypothetical protein
MDDDGTGLSLSGHGDEKQQGTGNGFHFRPAWPSAVRLATRGFTGRVFCR